MATEAKPASGKTRGVYELEGTLFEPCSCGVLCPCWMGEDPDGGECWAMEAYHIDRGQIDGVDVSGLTYVQIEYVPGNILEPGTWRQVRIVDAAGTEEQRRVLLAAFRGEYGGPLADLADLVAEELGVETLPIRHEVVGARARSGSTASPRRRWSPTAARTGA